MTSLEQLFYFTLPEELKELGETLMSAPNPTSMHRAGGGGVWLRSGGDPTRVRDWCRFEDRAMAEGPEGAASNVPTAVLRWPAISPRAKLVYSLLIGYGQRSTRHLPATLQIYREAGLAESEFWEHVRELRRAGLLGLEDRGLGRTPKIVFRAVPGYLWDGKKVRRR